MIDGDGTSRVEFRPRRTHPPKAWGGLFFSKISQPSRLTRSAGLVLFAVCATAVPQATGAEPASSFGGPRSVTTQVAIDAGKRDAAGSQRGRPKGPAGWSAFKSALKDQHGLSFGGDLNLLTQSASVSPSEKAATGVVARIYGSWTVTGRDTPDTGQLVFKLEERSRLWTDIPPQSLGPALGYAGLTSLTFSDAGLLLTNLYWQQSFRSDRVAFVAGIVDVTDYMDVYGLGNPWTDFNNLAFSTNPTIPAPNQGLGAALRVRLGDNYYFLAGLADANGTPNDPLNGIEDFVQTGETFKHAEIGWFESWEDRFTDNAHLTLWQSDPRDEAGVVAGWGLSASVGRTIAERWSPFLRAGYADGGGALVDRAVSIGTGYSLFDGRDQIGAGVGWARAPSRTTGDATRNQYTAEAFYRYQPIPSLQITPDLQLLANPAYALDQDKIWVGGLRIRFIF